MALSDVIAQIDMEIAKLQHAKELLSGTPDIMAKPGRGRPKGSKNASTKSADNAVAAATAPTKGKRKLSDEGRKAIADAMKKRWAERRTKVAK